MSDLFGDAAPSVTASPPDDAVRPLADRLRPVALGEVLGQDHLVGPEGTLTKLLASGTLPSMILWGPPGCGKTTLARLLARETRLAFEQLSAVFSGVADLRKVFERARDRRRQGHGTLLFVDEIHRFNRAQQDGFLPYVEDGTVVLVGATTENPSFELNAALLSRCRVLVLRRLEDDALDKLLSRAGDVPLTEGARALLRAMADGDGRYLLNLVEQLQATAPKAPLDEAALGQFLQRRAPVYDKDREGHYNLISAVHKSLRGSDPDAALYWVSRMLDGGEDPTYILRRLTRFAVEDVGLAEPGALTQAIAAWEAYDRLGSPEGDLAIGQLTLYLAVAPKSNAGYVAFKKASKAARATGSLMPPAHILNAPTRLMKDLGYGKGYAYDHDQDEAFSGQDYFPEDMVRQTFYTPTARGREKTIGEHLQRLASLRTEKQKDRTP